MVVELVNKVSKPCVGWENHVQIPSTNFQNCVHFYHGSCSCPDR